MTISRKSALLLFLVAPLAESRLKGRGNQEQSTATPGKRRMPRTQESAYENSFGAERTQRRMPGTRDNIFSFRTMMDDEDDFDPEPVQYIVGGGKTDPERFPYFASLYQKVDDTDYHVCGGTLIHDDIVLTAAHCAEHSHRVRIGAYTALTDPTNGGRPYHDSKVEAFSSHPDFYSDTLQRLHYDFALLQLKDPVTNPYLLDSLMSLEDVVEADASMTNGVISASVTAIGLGRLYDDGPLPDFLNEVDLRYMSNDRCSRYFGEVPNEMLCAKEYKKDACTGDSGGPLIIKGNSPEEDIQIGVTSWGSGCATEYPGAYARISVVADWIEQQLCELSAVKPWTCAAMSRVSRCVEKDYCETGHAYLPAGLWCFMNGSVCQVTCGKCQPEQSISSDLGDGESSPAV